MSVIDRPRSRKSMLVLTLPKSGREVGITFRHFMGTAIVRGVSQRIQMTRCCIWEIFSPDAKKEAVLITYGVAKCSPSDQFNKNTGRKISLTRALLEGKHFLTVPAEEPTPPDVKEDRTAIWWAYLNRGNHDPSESNGNDQPNVLDGEVINEVKALPPIPLELPPSTSVH